MVHKYVSCLSSAGSMAEMAEWLLVRWLNANPYLLIYYEYEYSYKIWRS